MIIITPEGNKVYTHDISYIADSKDFQYSMLYQTLPQLFKNCIIDLSIRAEDVGNIYDISKKLQENTINNIEELHNKRDKIFTPSKSIHIPKTKVKTILNLAKENEVADYNIVSKIPNTFLIEEDIVVFKSRDEKKLFVSTTNGRKAYVGMNAIEFTEESKNHYKTQNASKNFYTPYCRCIFAGKTFLFNSKNTSLIDFLKGKFKGMVSLPVFMQYVIQNTSDDTEITKEMFENLLQVANSKDKETKRHALEMLSNLDYVKYATLAYQVINTINKWNYIGNMSINARAMMQTLTTIKKQ